jgi:hypothetical protein
VAAAAALNGLGAFAGVALALVAAASAIAWTEGRLRVLKLTACTLGALVPVEIGAWLLAWWRLATAALGPS